VVSGRNIYEQQAANKRQTVFVMAGFILFLAFLGFGFDALYLGSVSRDFFFPIGTMTALAVGFGSAFWGFRSGSKAVLASAGAVPANPANEQQRQLINVVEEMSIASGLPKPSVYVVPDPDPNAFATGNDPATSSIAVTEGLLRTLNREELQGVVAHEMSHIRNYDVRLMTVVAALMGAVLLLAGMSRRGMFFRGGSGRRREGGGAVGGPLTLVLLIIWLVTMILSPIIARAMAMAVSRKREYLADASGAELTRNPLGLASALRKLEGASAPTASIKAGHAHLCIVDPLGRRVNMREGPRAELFGTHPPIEKRIMALEAMAYRFPPSSSHVGATA
jgi:heat shock protein HtpX